jgi:3-hydroxyacyl-CoA dehydrogenase/enoyl-CoA hydratase/3-hydroxybutyryl-CoA epimerase
MSAFRLEVDADGIGTLTFDLPGEKVNTFSRAVVEELGGIVASLAGRKELRALVVRSGKPDTFVAGADLDEFLLLRREQDAVDAVRKGQQLFDLLASLPVPTVAAIGGAALGGGCELALACDRRIATDSEKTRIGFPETMLGIFPGWGGTHRLARLVGARAALDVILAGKSLVPGRARAIGLVDEVVPAPLVDGRARAVAVELAAKGKPSRPPGRGKGIAGLLLDANPLGRSLVFALAKRGVLKLTRGHYPAPLAALDSVRRGFASGQEAAQREDAKAIGRLATGEVSRNLLDIHFWSERAKKESGLPDGVSAEPIPISAIGVLGAGVMGGGVAQLAADRADAIAKGGIPLRVRMKDVAPEALARGMEAARGLWKDAVRKRRIPARQLPYLLNRITPTLDWSGFDACDVTIEAVVEKLEIKRAVLAEWEDASPERSIFASNTSTLPIGEIAANARHPERVVGMHFFNPVHKMPLVEVIPGPKSSPETVATIVALAKAMGKTPVVVADRPGFLVNRVLGTYLNEAVLMVEEGSPAETVDRAGLDFGLPMGPLTLLDEVGLDVAAKAAHVLVEAFGNRMKGASGFDSLAAAGHLGRKVGKGFFRYEKGKRVGIDPAAIEIVRKGAAGAASPSPSVPIVDRLILPMIKEAVICLDEGVVASPEKLDLAMIFGIGFPPFRGGPAKYVDSRGAADVVASLERLAASCGPRFAPPGRLAEMARTGSRFHAART